MVQQMSHMNEVLNTTLKSPDMLAIDISQPVNFICVSRTAIKGRVTCHQKELFHLSVKELSPPMKDPLELFQYLLPFSKYTSSKFDGF